MARETQTIAITNFSGRLTRILNGDLNSGFAKFDTSFGYDPFSKPMNLTWLDKPVNLKASMVGGSTITDLPVAAKIRSEGFSPFVYIIGNAGNLYKLNPAPTFASPFSDSIVGISSVKNGTSFLLGGSMEFASNASVESIFIGHDNGVNAVRFDGSAETKIGNQSHYMSGISRPLKQFLGKVLFGNGPTIGAIDATGTVVSPVSSIVSALSTTSSIVSIYSELTPPFPPETVVQDVDVTPSLDYALITTSNVAPNYVATGFPRQAYQASDSTLYKWNGVDAGTTAGITMQAYAATALQTYLQNNIFFSNDAFGSSVSDGVKKILTLPRNTAPSMNATGSTGNFLYWICPEVNVEKTTQVASFYYFGSLDNENPSGLYRLFRHTSSITGGFVTSTPLVTIVGNSLLGNNNSVSSIVTIGSGKHYFSTYEADSPNGGQSVLGFYGFIVNSSGNVAPQNGVYETQTQIFSKRVGITQIRVYTQPTVAGNAFRVDIIGSDGNTVENGTYTYSFGEIVDPQSGSTSVERINFNTNPKTQYAVGIRVTNLGTTNMVIKKIELDYTEEGK